MPEAQGLWGRAQLRRRRLPLTVLAKLRRPGRGRPFRPRRRALCPAQRVGFMCVDRVMPMMMA